MFSVFMLSVTDRTDRLSYEKYDCDTTSYMHAPVREVTENGTIRFSNFGLHRKT